MAETIDTDNMTEAEKLDADLIKYVRGNREPLAIHEAATDLACLGRNGAAWPRKSRTAWEKELRRLAAEGRLVMHEGGRVYPPAPTPESPPAARPAATPLRKIRTPKVRSRQSVTPSRIQESTLTQQELF